MKKNLFLAKPLDEFTTEKQKQKCANTYFLLFYHVIVQYFHFSSKIIFSVLPAISFYFFFCVLWNVCVCIWLCWLFYFVSVSLFHIEFAVCMHFFYFSLFITSIKVYCIELFSMVLLFQLMVFLLCMEKEWQHREGEEKKPRATEIYVHWVICIFF